MKFAYVKKGMIAALVSAGWSGRRIARRYNWSKSYVLKYVNEYKKTGKFVSRLFRRVRKRIATPTTDRWISRSVYGLHRIGGNRVRRSHVNWPMLEYAYHLELFERG